MSGLTVPQYRIVICGARGAGKSCLVNRQVVKEFTKDFSSAEDGTYRLNFTVDGQACVLELTDLGCGAPAAAYASPGGGGSSGSSSSGSAADASALSRANNEHMRRLDACLAAGQAQGVICVYSADSAAQLQHVAQRIAPRARAAFGAGDNPSVMAPVVLVGARADLSEQAGAAAAAAGGGAASAGDGASGAGGGGRIATAPPPLAAPWREAAAGMGLDEVVFASALTGAGVEEAFAAAVRSVRQFRSVTRVRAPLVARPTPQEEERQAKGLRRFMSKLGRFFKKKERSNSQSGSGSGAGLGGGGSGSGSAGSSSEFLRGSGSSFLGGGGGGLDSPKGGRASTAHQSIQSASATSAIIQPEDLVLESAQLGKGGSGVVKRGVWLGTNDVAVKTINNLPEFTTDEERDELLGEISLLCSLRHPNVVQMFGYCIRSDDIICLITEFVTGGDLTNYMRPKDGSVTPEHPLDQAQTVMVCKNLAAGMVYLHNQRVVHRDLKPGNVLVEKWETGAVRVCDFGLSRRRDEGAKFATANIISTPSYSAPELRSKEHSFPVDVYSFAIILWEMLTGYDAWFELPHPAMIPDAVAGGGRPTPDLPQGPLADLVAKCWDQNPASRPTFKDAHASLVALERGLPPPTRTSPAATESAAAPASAAVAAAAPAVAAAAGGGGSSMPSVPPQEGIVAAFGGQEVGVIMVLAPVVAAACGGSTEAAKSLLTYAAGAPVAEGTAPPAFGQVRLSQVQHMLQWFTPVVHEAQAAAGVYTLSRIASILDNRDFRGFMGMDAVVAALIAHDDGAFLFRFSTTPKCIALSSKSYGYVSHWRFNQDDATDSLVLDGVKFRTLEEIVAKHRLSPLRGSRGDDFYLSRSVD